MMAEPTTDNKGETLDELDERGKKAEKSSVKMEKGRKEKRKERKKMKRKELRREAAEMEKKAEEAWLNDPALQEKLEREAAEERAERERALKEFEERERAWIEFMVKKKKAEEEEEEEESRRKILQEASREQKDGESDRDDDDWEYVEEGPAEIIWQGNEIIVRKKKVKVPKKETSQVYEGEDADRPTSNPLPPQSEVFADYLNASSAQQLLENVAKEVPNFGTEQDKAHCPFHLKTGACRFGQRCSRVHFYPDKSCTLLIRSMYNGAGLALDQDEGLEYTDEEIEHCYEEFYEDVHTEFLKFGEIVNFKVCRNGSFHLRGNVYVHYKTLESALCAYNAVNGRYFAGKQVQCEFVNVTRWKVAICGEFMKSRLKTCSRGSACNFIHCFRNPGGDYEWADWDKSPPRYWVKRMAALFGYSDQYAYGETMESENLQKSRSSSMMTVSHSSSWHRSRRSRSREIDNTVTRYRSSDDEHDIHDTGYQKRHRYHNRKERKNSDESFLESQKARHRHYRTRSFSNGDMLAMDMEEGEDSDLVGLHHARKKMKSRHHNEVYDKEFERGVSEDDLVMDSEYGDLHYQIRNERTRKRSKDISIDEDGGKRMHEAETQLGEESNEEIHHCHSTRRRAGSPTDERHGRKRSHDGAFIEKQREDAGSGRHRSHQQKKSSKYRDKDGDFSDDHEDADNCNANRSDKNLEGNRNDRYHKREPSRHTNRFSKLSVDSEYQENKLREKPDSKRYSRSRSSYQPHAETSEARRYRSSELDYQHDERESRSSLDRWEPPALEEVLDDDVDGMDRWEPESPEQEEKTVTKKETWYKSGDSDRHHRKNRSHIRHSHKRRSRHKDNERDSSGYEDYEEGHKTDHVRDGTQ